MSDKPIPTRAVSENENILRKKFYEAIAAQSDLMDKVSERLLTLELGIPGLYAMALKLIQGDKATIAPGSMLYLTFGCWLLALLATLVALIPKKRNVNMTILKQDPKRLAEGMGIEDFFEQSALYKQRLVIASSLFFFCGIFCAILTLG